jgi:hypothetical protein
VPQDKDQQNEIGGAARAAGVGDHRGDHRRPNPEAPQAPLIFATARLPRTCSPAIRSEWRSACPAFLATALLRVSALSGSRTNDLHRPRTTPTLAELLTEENVEAVAALDLYSQYDEDLAERDRRQRLILAWMQGEPTGRLQ